MTVKRSVTVEIIEAVGKNSIDRTDTDDCKDSKGVREKIEETVERVARMLKRDDSILSTDGGDSRDYSVSRNGSPSARDLRNLQRIKNESTMGPGLLATKAEIIQAVFSFSVRNATR